MSSGEPKTATSSRRPSEGKWSQAEAEEEMVPTTVPYPAETQQKPPLAPPPPDEHGEAGYPKIRAVSPGRGKAAQSPAAAADASYNDEVEITEGTVAGQFFTTVKKNMVLKLRDPVNLMLEVFIPVLFAVGIVGIWAAIPNDTFDGESLLNNEVRPDFTKSPPDFVPELNERLFCHNWTQAEYNSRLADPARSNPGLQLCNFSAHPFDSSMMCFPETNNELCTLNVQYSSAIMHSWLSINAKAIPTLDSMIMMMIFGKATLDAELQTWDPTYAAVSKYGKIHMVGDPELTQELRWYLGNRSYLWEYVNGQDFDTVQAANDYASTAEQEGKVWGIISFEQFDDDTFHATLHFNKSGVPDTDSVLDRFSGGGLGAKAFLRYFGTGFLTWQRIINEFYYYKTDRPAPEAPWVAPMPYLRWTNVAFLNGAGTMVPLMIVFSFLYPVSQQTKRLVEEKEKRVREAMMIMGLGSGSFYLSHWLTYQCIYLTSSLIISILFKLTVFQKTDFFLTFFLFYLFTLSCISLASLFSSVFSKSRLAALLSPLGFFVVALPYFAVDNAPASMKSFFSLLSPSAFAIGTDLMTKYEKSTGMGWGQFGSSQDSFSMAAVFFFLIFDTVAYFLLAMWFDNVLPSEWGTQEHCCFCYLRLAGMCRATKAIDGEENDGRDPKGQFEENPAGTPSIELRGLRKEFKRGDETFTAVDDLTFNLYEGQISVLLGHNGAGKTTAISLMTGMLAPDAGDCLVYGKSVRTNMRGVRQEIGFCPQHNILWDDMTCREHLEYFAKLKGLVGEEMEEAVLEMIRAVDLEPKLDQKSSSLSGGMKRKLSVAIAFVGRSRVVFLDEPTAGMDVMARRHTWDLIKRMAPGRTIIMTTHYMDEADLLGNQIAIMTKGKLKCKGSSLFLKSRLGVGYTLNCSIDAAASVDAIGDAIHTNVARAEILNHSSGEVSYRLPMNQVAAFPAMLRTLEENMNTFGLRSFGLSVTTLEEVFLKIGHDDPNEGTDAASPSPHREAYVNDPKEEDTAAVTIDEDAWHKHSSQESSAARQLTTLISKRWSYAKRDTRTQVFQIWMPIVVIVIAMLLSLIGGTVRTSKSIPLNPTMYAESDEGKGRDFSTPYADCSSSNFTNNDVWHPLVTLHEDYETTNATEFSIDLQRTFLTHDKLRMTALFCADSNMGGPDQNWSTPWVLHNASGRHASPEALQQYYSTNLKTRFGPSIDATISSKPLDLTTRETAVNDGFTDLFIAIFILIPFTFIPSTFVSFVVKEREYKAKHAQMIAGMNPIIYWVSNFCFDVICFICTNMLAIIIFAIFGRDEYIGGATAFFGTFLLLLFYAASGITGAYFCSFAFDNHGSAQNVVMLANFLAGFLLVITVWFLQLFESTKTVGDALPWIFRIVPSYCLGEGILNMATRNLLTAFGDEKKVFDMNVLGWNIVYMAVEVPLFMAITMFLDSPQRAAAEQRMLHNPDQKPEPIEDEDVDVTAERDEVESGRRANDLVTVRNLCKKYPNGKVAVKNLSFGVKPGEVFGFLGTNGAGKTSSMSILCGEQVPTHGYAFVGGYDVVSESAEARRVVGYCPQFDNLLDLLNAEEHLYLYAGLRGIPLDVTKDVVESLIAKAGLAPHRKTLSMNMSGGNRRKLSVAIALIGGPKVVVLDEPSAGMDPMARRGLWGVIEAVAAKCAIVLTTHHLEEVENLANRVAIMDQGALRCIGTLQQLKHKFGSGFEMSIRISAEDKCEPLREFILQQFPQAKEEEYRQQKFTFALPEDTKLSATFGLIEEQKEALGITDYSISQTSLEQVFMRIGAAEEEQ